MAEINLQSQGIQAPSSLGVTTVYVPQGTAVKITHSMLMSSMFPYTQPQSTLQYPFGYPMGSIIITGHNGNYELALSEFDTGNTIASLYWDTARIYKTSQNSIIFNDEVDYDSIHNELFKVNGLNIGTADVTYKAMARDPDTGEESQYSLSQGTIRIRVIPSGNQPPTNIDDSQTFYLINTTKTLTMEYFSVNYSDPNGDPIWKVRIDSLPAEGILNFMGIPVTVGQEILATQITMGGLTYTGPANDSIGQVRTFTFSVNDTGTGTYIS